MTARWIGEYEIVRRLRVGGMATLYLARKHGAAGFSRFVVIKVIHPHLLEQPQFVEMFVDEARICSQISHPNVIHIEEFGEIDGQHFLVMEYIEGCSANELLQTPQPGGARAIPPEIAAYIVMQAARGLHAAHECIADGVPLEVIHRDITPSNILLSLAGHVKLIDFGIAKARNRLSETETGFALKGKYRYIAPEQATPAKLDRRTDIFSLGVVFWELLTGWHLFPEDTHVSLFNRLTETVVEPPSAKNPDAPIILDSIVMAMLQHDRADRPQTAHEVHRLIARTMPAATTIDSETVGRYVAQARAHRQATRAGTEDRIVGDQSFSATPRPTRSFTTHAPEDYRIEVTQDLPVVAEPPTEAMPLPPSAPPAPTRRRLVPIAIGGVIAVAGVIAALVITSKRTNEPTSTAAKTPAPSIVEPAPAPTPAPAPITTTTPAPAPPPPAPPVVEPVTTTEPTRAVVVAPKRVAPVRARNTPPPPKAAVAETPKRSETPVPAARAKTIRTGKATFVDTAFDDASNSATTTTAPSRTKVKKTTIVTDFGN